MGGQVNGQMYGPMNWQLDVPRWRMDTQLWVGGQKSSKEKQYLVCNSVQNRQKALNNLLNLVNSTHTVYKRGI